MEEEWLNPESPKYYKGFRYEKNLDTGSEFWYDENDMFRKRITYYDNGNKWFEVYRNEKKASFHNEDDFAIQEWYEDGDILLQEYWLDGVQLTEEEWKEKTGKVESPQPDYLNPQSDKYYKGYRYEKDEDGDEFWYDENGICRKRKDYYDNGNKRMEVYWNKLMFEHNEEGPAIQFYHQNGDIQIEEYWLNGKKLSEQQWKEKVSRLKKYKYGRK